MHEKSARARGRYRMSTGGIFEPTPVDIDVEAWFRADLGTTIASGRLSAWADQSGRGHHTNQTDPAQQPPEPSVVASLGGQLATIGSGAQGLSGIGGTEIDLSAGWTFYSVFRTPSAFPVFMGLFRVAATAATGTGGTDGAICYVQGSGSVVLGSPDATAWYRLTTGGVLVPNTSYVVLGQCAGSSASLSLQRGVITPSGITWATAGLGGLSGTFAMPSASGRYPFPMMGYNPPSARYPDAFAEQGIFRGPLTAPNEDFLKSYLAARYAR